MGLDTLVDVVNGQIIDQDDPNTIHRVLKGDLVGRDSSGAPTANQNLGTALIPWGTGRITNLILNGLPVDPGTVTAQPNRVVSGAVRPTSEFPLYLIASGAVASFTVLGNTTNLVFDVNGVTSQIAADIVKVGLTLAPSVNNTCLINDIDLTGQDTSRFLGENNTGIDVDTMGTELTGKIGEFVALLNQTSGEIIYCRIESSTRLDNVRRGLFFDSVNNPIKAAVLNNNEVFQLLSLGFIFAEDDGVTIDVTYRTPVISGDQPSAPQTGDYWFDLAVNIWKRYNGSSFAQIDRTYIGTAVIDTSKCIGTRSEYFTKSYKDDNTLKVLLSTVDIIVSKTADFLVSIDGSGKRLDFSFFTWNAATDFESGVSRTVSRNYWLYITEDGKPIISDKKPYDNRSFLRGWYHTHESWRAVAQIFNNASNQFELVSDSDAALEEISGVLLLGRIILSNSPGDPTNDIDFSAGKFTFDDFTGRQNSLVLTKKLDTVFSIGDNVGGLDTGVKAADSTYHCFAIYNPNDNIADYLFSTSATAPTLPTGFTKKRLIGSILTDALLAIEPFLQTDKTFTLDNNQSDLNFAGTTGITRVLQTVSVPAGRKVRAILAMTFFRAAGGAADLAIRITDPDQADQAPVHSTPWIFDIENANQLNFPAKDDIIIEKQTNTSAQIGYRFSAAANMALFAINTIGWIDYDLE